MGIFSRKVVSDAIATESSSTDNVIDGNVDDVVAIENLDQAAAGAEQTAEQSADAGAAVQEAETQEATQEGDAPVQIEEQQLDQAGETQEAVQEETQLNTDPTSEAVVQEQTAEQVQEQAAEGAPVQQDAASEGETEGKQEAEIVVQEADTQEAAEVTQEAAAESITAEVGLVRSTSNKAYGLITNGLMTSSIARRSDDLRQSIRDIHLVQNLTKVAEENQFSAPMMAAIHAIPGIDQVIKNLPAQSQYNVVPMHPTDLPAIAGMESFIDASLSATDTMRTKAQGVVDAYTQILNALPETVAHLRARITEDQAALESSDITDDVLATIPVCSLDDAVFSELLMKTDSYLRTVTAFDVEDLKANPELLAEEVKGLQAMVIDGGTTFGLAMDQFGLRETDTAADYIPTLGTFGEKKLDGAGVGLMLARAGSVVEALNAIAQNKDDMISAMNVAVESMPMTLDSNDVTYGALDHTTLINSHATFVAKLVTDSVQSVALSLSTVNSILDIDTTVEA
jgi:hypothetical protein